MSRATWIMMIVLCSFTWGGFVGTLLYGARQAGRDRTAPPGARPAERDRRPQG